MFLIFVPAAKNPLNPVDSWYALDGSLLIAADADPATKYTVTGANSTVAIVLDPSLLAGFLKHYVVLGL